jgi:hypothetical protein
LATAFKIENHQRLIVSRPGKADEENGPGRTILRRAQRKERETREKLCMRQSAILRPMFVHLIMRPARGVSYELNQR